MMMMMIIILLITQALISPPQRMNNPLWIKINYPRIKLYNPMIIIKNKSLVEIKINNLLMKI